MDLLDVYEATALSHPVDKKNIQKVQRRLDSIQNEINIKLYGQTQKKGKDFWDMMRKGKLDNV